MNGDIARFTFDALKHYTRVVTQQGRVQLEADWNEQVAILLHYLQTLAADLIGSYGGPQGNLGFELKWLRKDEVDGIASLSDDEKAKFKDLLDRHGPSLWIAKGRYYVDGRMCENEGNILYSGQPSYVNEVQANGLVEGSYLIYLDVWERPVSALEDPAIREVALDGPDTAARSQLVWQVKIDTPADEKAKDKDCTSIKTVWDDFVKKWQPPNRGKLKAQAKEQDKKATEPCLVEPEARYRGVENQLYRVEIHQGSDPDSSKVVTFKWSRENASVVAAIEGIEDKTLTISGIHDQTRGFEKLQWVELTHDDWELQGKSGTLVRLSDVQGDRLICSEEPPFNFGQVRDKHPKVRRWDQRETEVIKLQGGAVPVKEGEWIPLEDGVQVWFEKPSTGETTYRTGDYWLIPARVAIGDVEWPKDETGARITQPPHGVEHHYAPLAVLEKNTAGEVAVKADLRHKFEPLGKC